MTKAQIIISSQLNQTVFQEYTKLQKQLKEGTLTIEQAKQLSYELRLKPNKPEEITVETIDSSLDFLTNDSYFEDLHREKEKKETLLKNTLKYNEELEREIKRRDDIERKNDQVAKEKKRALEKNVFLATEWQAYKRIQISSLTYFLLVVFLTILPILIGFTLKVNSDLNNWMVSLGNNQYYVWAILTLIFLVELFGRAYLFNKDKVKSGWFWLKTIAIPGNLSILKANELKTFGTQFEKQYRDL